MVKDSDSSPAPSGWTDDEVSSFLEAAHKNSFAVFDNLRVYFGHLVTFDGLFRTAAKHFGGPTDWLLGVFLLRSHASYLGTVRLAVSGQLPETYMLLRALLETSLYAFHIEADPARARVWLDRTESAEARQKARNEFSNRRVLATLKAADPKLHSAVEALYERTIDDGAHPNPTAFLSNMALDNESQQPKLELRYLSGPGPALQAVLLSLLQTTLACLSVFELAVPEKFALLGISDKLKWFRKRL